MSQIYNVEKLYIVQPNIKLFSRINYSGKITNFEAYRKTFTKTNYGGKVCHPNVKFYGQGYS
jgi:hypothetical protein